MRTDAVSAVEGTNRGLHPWVVAAGPVDHLEQCQPVFRAISQGLFVVGEEPWTANVIKIVGNFLIAAIERGLH
jgi:3-hydroxyisobutyrate dehydrogenase-like beta-hydroxyacid dehydrogenase